jgi:succinate dehydrogenase / fumarate reductase membrane anchor subunit
MNTIVEPLKRAKALGSAKTGTSHYISHKVSSVALILMSFWLLPEMLGLAAGGMAQADIIAWLQQPVDAIILLLFTLTAAYHFYGLVEEVATDYIPGEAARLLTLVAVKFIVVLLAFSSCYAILFMSFVSEIPNVPVV